MTPKKVQIYCISRANSISSPPPFIIIVHTAAHIHARDAENKGKELM